MYQEKNGMSRLLKAGMIGAQFCAEYRKERKLEWRENGKSL